MIKLQVVIYSKGIQKDDLTYCFIEKLLSISALESESLKEYMMAFGSQDFTFDARYR